MHTHATCRNQSDHFDHHYERGVKMFSTKTRRDVGMVPCVSEEHVCLHGKTIWWKNSRNKEGYHSMLTNRGEHSAASRNKEGYHSTCST